ncbi:MAG: carbon-nitrogen hydrolase family protein [Pseudomonadota bacterium]
MTASEFPRIAAWQMVSTSNWLENQVSLSRGFAQASAAGVKLLVLPENAAVFGAGAQLTLAARGADILSWFAAQSAEHQLTLVAGTLPLACRPDGLPVPNGRVRSATMVWGPAGELLGRYDKRHLFDVDVADAQGRYQESATYEPGNQVAVIDTELGKLGILTCYDLRFPEQARELRRQGAELLVVPAAFTAVTGAAHWQVLLRARAIENQCLVIGAGQGGQHSPQRQTWGHSQVVDAWGVVLAEQQEDGEGLVMASFDRAEQDSLRQRMPVEQHRLD